LHYNILIIVLILPSLAWFAAIPTWRGWNQCLASWFREAE